MKRGNIVGSVGLVFFALSFTSDRMSGILGSISIGLFLVAAWLQPRKWLLAVGVIAVMMGLMFLLLRHRD